ncbi:MAG: hypothetical protein WBM75_18685 [Polyangiales bacterium]|jgi:hypothetical protein
MTEAGGEIRRRARAAALVAFAAELDALTRRVKRLASVDPETSARAGAIHVVISREIHELQKELPKAGK